ncbi:succinate dehydrogenase flavoprotein subunit [compost metagenome]
MSPGEGATSDEVRKSGATPTRELVKRIQNQVFPLKINYFRSERGLTQALAKLNELWPEVNHQIVSNVHDRVHAREAASMAATARWMYTAALARKERRGEGLHVLQEYPDVDPEQQHRLLVSGLEEIRVGTDRSFLAPASFNSKSVHSQEAAVK